MTAPAIRLVDEMGHEVSDRYYKLGSSVDVTCQVALSFLNTIPSPTTNSNDKFPSAIITSTTTTTTTTTFPFIDTNLIRKTFEQQIPYSGKHNIKWKKDGKDLPKDIKINLRFVWRNQISSLFVWSPPTRALNYNLLSSPPPFSWNTWHEQHIKRLEKQSNFDFTCWKNTQRNLFLLCRQHDVLNG